MGAVGKTETPPTVFNFTFVSPDRSEKGKVVSKNNLKNFRCPKMGQYRRKYAGNL
jgi:hypothetical protein